MGSTCLVLNFFLVQPVLLYRSCFGKGGVDQSGLDARLGMSACPFLDLGQCVFTELPLLAEGVLWP